MKFALAISALIGVTSASPISAQLATGYDHAMGKFGTDLPPSTSYNSAEARWSPILKDDRGKGVESTTAPEATKGSGNAQELPLSLGTAPENPAVGPVETIKP